MTVPTAPAGASGSAPSVAPSHKATATTTTTNIHLTLSEVPNADGSAMFGSSIWNGPRFLAAVYGPCKIHKGHLLPEKLKIELVYKSFGGGSNSTTASAASESLSRNQTSSLSSTAADRVVEEKLKVFLENLLATEKYAGCGIRVFVYPMMSMSTAAVLAGSSTCTSRPQHSATFCGPELFNSLTCACLHAGLEFRNGTPFCVLSTTSFINSVEADSTTEDVARHVGTKTNKLARVLGFAKVATSCSSRDVEDEAAATESGAAKRRKLEQKGNKLGSEEEVITEMDSVVFGGQESDESALSVDETEPPAASSTEADAKKLLKRARKQADSIREQVRAVFQKHFEKNLPA
ncbi:unnamed protein product [Amoebophrya sp. A120]|nr:unnamed protein product [Amoebophrya sp. A120]|eukprot:GSA120T00010001001.1